MLGSLDRIEQRLAESVHSADRIADVTARHLLDAGGKRVRPLLTLLAAEVAGEVTDEVIEAAVVVELTHLASLYHDDVMDSAPMRRGVQTAHTVWGNTVAILTGDMIFARASAMVSALGQEPLMIQATTFERLVIGQLQETTGPAPDEDPVAHYIKVLSGKTGSLIAASGQYGALLGGAPRSVVDLMVVYGEKVGLAFQLADDIIDLTGHPDVSGKTRGTDLREGVDTLPVLLLRRDAAGSDPAAAASARELLELVDGDLSDDAALARAVEAVSEHPAAAEAWQIANDWADEAIAALEPLDDSVAKAALIEFAHGVVHRRG
ncbi:polyprenyl synthetase family protein [Kocuria indica]|uniref:Polyprenyl synthetase family protein n=1 Tax=Kocuria marina subsp. indica TaxID=1049583 RepID=A0A6N9R066_9MICC|nr:MULTISPECIES: polyprenyl synthetase family protein [Kocuria]MCT1616350.1 polyprenyl synthetase family protein [Kocuria marina]NDO78905.1 polyprenyl synthetase family protein [Kocuria indica]